MTTDPVTDALALTTDEPASVADALDAHIRLAALEGWATDRKRQVAAWALARGQDRAAEDGAAPTWRLDAGQVIVTDPKPKPAVTDPDRFARWYVSAVLGDDADRRPDPPADVLWFDSHVAVRLVATVDSPHLVRFLADEGFAGDDVEQRAGAAARLAAQVRVDEQWLAGDDVLNGLLSGSIGPTGDPVVTVDADRLLAFHVDTGEIVPGVEVRAPGDPTVQFRPNATAKRRVRAELDGLLGSPGRLPAGAPGGTPAPSPDPGGSA